MDELAKVRQLHDDVLEPDRTRLAVSRRKLVAATAGKTAPRRPRPGWQLTALGAAAAIGAVVLLATNLVSEPDDTSGPASAVGIGFATVPEMLEHAAAVVENRPSSAGQDGQWVYTKRAERNVTDQEHPRTISEEWTRYANPAFENGSKGDDYSPRKRFGILSSLPDDSDQVLDAIRKVYPTGGEKMSAAHHGYNALTVLVDAYPMPSKALAKLYRALASIKGVDMKDGLVRDAAGRPAIAVFVDSAKDADQSMRQILIDPNTYDIAGTRLVAGQVEEVPKDGPIDKPRYKAGDTILEYAILKEALVERNHQRP